MKPRDRTQLAQESARLLATEREIDRQRSQRQQPATAGRFNVEDATYDVNSGGQSVGSGQSISTSGIAPGQSVEFLEGAGTVDVTPRVRPRPSAPGRVFPATAEPRAAIVLNRAVFRGIRIGEGIPGYLAPPTLPTIATIYALSRGPNFFGTITDFPVPPIADLQTTPRYREVPAPYPRCEIGFSLWDDPLPFQITADASEFYTDPRHRVLSGPAAQEVICFTAALGTPLPDLPRFFPRFEGVCQWNSEFELAWVFVEQYQTEPGNPAGVWIPGIPGGVSEDATRVYLLLSSDGSLVEVFRLSDEFTASVILAIDAQGTAHITFRWRLDPRSTVFQLAHFQVTNGAVVQVASNSSWRADFANRPRTDSPIPSADACVTEYRDDNNRNLIDSTLYELDRSPTWADLLNPDGFTLNLLGREVSSDGAICTVGTTTTTALTIQAPISQLTGRAGGFYEGGEVAAYAGGVSQ